ncbi:alpha/beta hydrolase family protein [Psychromonas ossibalaenae]|uniref:alpha/beta hydrolase family protein n=1 Tax=Psychromonas ossibalaenae TaxID=444922 RepID=UPI000376B2AD|nr:alpha/beta fold hydrolase [Psychromonas ossibalaenae]
MNDPLLEEIILIISNMNYSAGSKTIKIQDEINNINFQSWILYPSIDNSQDIKIGPYSINVCPEGKLAKGNFPLVIISHGGGGSHLLYRIVAQHLAENGYIVAMPEHHGNNRNDNYLEGHNKNLTLRTRHIRLVTDTLLCDPELMECIDSRQIFMIGHSMGGSTALAVAGAVPWSIERKQVEVVNDQRVKALVLFAPAAAWFQQPDSFNHVNLPILFFSAEHDTLTPYWQADLIKQNVKNPALITLKTVENAGHLSFLAPFPESMRNKYFSPSQDPDGFDREAFHEKLKTEVLNYFNKQRGNKQ